MNIVQLHERVRFWLDQVGSARFEPFDIDNAVNSAMNEIVEERYQSSQRLSKGDSFQRSQRVRDELSNIVKKFEPSTTETVGQSLIPVALYPANYKYLLALSIKDLPCTPTTYDRLFTIPLNPFRRVRSTLFPKLYYIESSEGITVKHIIPNVTKALVYYLEEATQWKYGIDYTSSKTFSVGNIIIANSDIVVYDGINYLRGDNITIVTGHTNITSGTVLYDYVNSNINSNLHEEIARKAAINALITIREGDKAKLLIEYSM
jgi:hypothetical protein